MYRLYYYRDNAYFGFDYPKMAYNFAERMTKINGTEYVVLDEGGYCVHKSDLVY